MRHQQTKVMKFVFVHVFLEEHRVVADVISVSGVLWWPPLKCDVTKFGVVEKVLVI